MTTAATRTADLLRAVLAEPDSDEPRLIYADWLEECGHTDRAEFIRVQLQLARLELRQLRLDNGTSSAEVPIQDRELYAKLHRRTCQLLWQYYGDWTPRLSPADILVVERPGTAVVQYGTYSPVSAQTIFRRGFVERVSCTAEDWLTYGSAARESQPIQAVTLTTRPAVTILQRDYAEVPDFDQRCLRLRARVVVGWGPLPSVTFAVESAVFDRDRQDAAVDPLLYYRELLLDRVRHWLDRYQYLKDWWPDLTFTMRPTLSWTYSTPPDGWRPAPD